MQMAAQWFKAEHAILWGHFARNCTSANTPKLLCRWCSPRDHEDTKCPKSGMNLITIRTNEEEVLAITRKQAKLYPDPTEEKKRLEEGQVKIEKATQAEKSQLKDTTGEHEREKASGANTADRREKESGASVADPMLLALTSGRHPMVVEMGILGMVISDTIVDRGSGVNVLPEDMRKKLGQPTLWPPTFQLLTTDQHSIKPLGILMAQPMTIGTQPFLLNFVVIPLKRGYDAILGQAWLVQAKVKHD